MEQIPWTRRCGECVHWQTDANVTGGVCGAKVPFWVLWWGVVSERQRYCAADEVRASQCDLFDHVDRDGGRDDDDPIE